MNHMTKNVKILISVLLLLIGFSSMGLSGYLYLKPLQEKTPEEIKSEAIAQCKGAGKMLNHIPSASGGILSFRTEGLDNWKSDLTSMSIIISRCPGFEIKEFCMGTTCLKNTLVGTYMELRYYKK